MYRVNTEVLKQEKNVGLGVLLDFYGVLLTEHQREIAEYSYNDDLSLSEIADITGITRQGVRASLEKTARELREFEAKLGLANKFALTRAELDRVTHLLEKMELKSDSDFSAVLDAVGKLKQICDM